MTGYRLWQIAGWTMLHYFWVGAALGAAALVARQWLRSAAAGLRYLMALASLLLLSMAPAAIAVVVMQNLAPVAPSESLPARLEQSANRPEAMRLEETQPAMAPADRPAPDASPETPGSGRFLAALDLAAMCLPWLWVCGAPLCFALTTAGLLGAERLRRQSHPLEDARITELCRRLATSLNVSCRVGVAICDRIAAPILAGVIRPLILLPAAALAGWDAQQLEMVLLHELAHVRRLDNLVNLLQRIVESLLFFHPMVWIVSGWVRREREHCCDALVVVRTRQPQVYAEMLVTLAETSSQCPLRSSLLVHPQAVSLMAERPLVARIRHILKKEEQSMQVSRKAVGLVLLGVLAIAVTIGSNYSLPTRAEDAPTAGDKQVAERTIRVHVVGPDGRPIPAAKIQISVWSDDPFKSNRDYTCDAEGQAVVQLPRTLHLLRLWASKAGYVPLFAHWEQEELQQDKNAIPDLFTFHLPKGTTIGGVVINEDGRPIAGAKVGVQCQGHQNDKQRVFTSVSLAGGDDARVTDTHGRWTLDNVPEGEEGEVLLSFIHPDYVSDLTWGGLQGIQNVTLQSLRQQKATIVMSRGITITGSVTDPDGKPVAGAGVVWGDDPYATTGSHQEHRQQVHTDAKGAYRLPPLPPLALTVTVIAKGWAPDLRHVAITPEDHKVDFQLKPGRTLQIRFVDESGKPIPGVFVQIHGWRGRKSLYNMKHPIVLETKIPGSADAKGIYRWTWAPEDAVEYGFGKEGYQRIENKSLTANGAEHEITLSRKTSAKKPDVTPTDVTKRAINEREKDSGSDDKSEERALEEFKSRYVLAEGEVCKHIPRPFLPGRLIYYRQSDPTQADAIPSGPDAMHLRWQDGELLPWGLAFGEQNLLRILEDVAVIYRQEVEGDEALVKSKIQGDWIVRKGAPKKDILSGLETILNKECGLHVKLRLRDVERQVIVASGEFDFHPFEGRSVYLYDDKPENNGHGGGGGDIESFVRSLGWFVHRRVLSDVKDPPDGFAWLYCGDRPQKNVKKLDVEHVLKHVTAQTGLSFKEESRSVPVLFVERGK
jgi:beta-lactamase regulating signal transducer with metallopeptidase domain